MALLLQILLLAIGVGGAIVTAITLSDPTWRFRCVIAFGGMGVLGLALTVVTYEQTPGVPHLDDAWNWLQNFAASIQRLPGFWVIVALTGGIFIGTLLPSIRNKIKDRRRGAVVPTWFSPLE